MMKTAIQSEVFSVLARHDDANSDAPAAAEISTADLLNALDEYYGEREFTAAVLGVDIYQYSRMSSEVQRVIPALFEYFREGAAAFCRDESAVFASDDHRWLERFVPTGDGCFQLLPRRFMRFCTPHTCSYS
jgi:hypothetical protein